MMMKNILTTSAKVLIAMALLPILITWAVQFPASWPLLVTIFVCAAFYWRITRRFLTPLLHALKWLVWSPVMLFTPLNNARYMNLWTQLQLFGSHRDGFIVDGYKKRFSSKTSFESVLTLGGMGRGKSSIFVIPNLLTITNGSFVISDTSGELYQNTSGYLKRQGYQIRVLNLMDPTRSDHYNPLHNATSFTEISQIAHTLVNTAFPESKDPFWNVGSEKIIRILLQCLCHADEPHNKHLANLKHLLTNFDLTKSPNNSLTPMDRFILNNTQHHPALFDEYRSFLAGNEKTMQSILMNAEIALNALGNPELASLTAKHTLDFSEMKKKKTALYVLCKQQDLSYSEFILNLFYTELFSTLLRDRDANDLPVYVLLDEFGHLQLNNFDVIITTARKYKIGIWIFLQSLSQLETRYGAAKARTILDGLQTEIYLPGQNLDVAQSLSQRIGHNSKNRSAVMTADQIINMKDHHALLFYSNKRPLKIRTKPYYKQYMMRRKTALSPAEFPHASSTPLTLSQLS